MCVYKANPPLVMDRYWETMLMFLGSTAFLQ